MRARTIWLGSPFGLGGDPVDYEFDSSTDVFFTLSGPLVDAKVIVYLLEERGLRMGIDFEIYVAAEARKRRGHYFRFKDAAEAALFKLRA